LTAKDAAKSLSPKIELLVKKYDHYGFCDFPDRRLRLFMPMKTIADLFP